MKFKTINKHLILTVVEHVIAMVISMKTKPNLTFLKHSTTVNNRGYTIQKLIKMGVTFVVFLAISYGRFN